MTPVYSGLIQFRINLYIFIISADHGKYLVFLFMFCRYLVIELMGQCQRQWCVFADSVGVSAMMTVAASVAVWAAIDGEWQ